MDYVLIIIAAGILFLFACSDKDSGDCPTDEYEYSVKTNSRIDTLTSNRIFSFQLDARMRKLESKSMEKRRGERKQKMIRERGKEM